jgi:hypothetical protein
MNLKSKISNPVGRRCRAAGRPPLSNHQFSARARAERDRRIRTAEAMLDRNVLEAESWPQGSKTRATYLQRAETARARIAHLESRIPQPATITP